MPNFSRNVGDGAEGATAAAAPREPGALAPAELAAIWLVAIVWASVLVALGVGAVGLALIILAALVTYGSWPTAAVARALPVGIAVLGACVVVLPHVFRSGATLAIGIAAEVVVLALGVGLGIHFRRVFDRCQRGYLGALAARACAEESARDAMTRMQDFHATVSEVHWEVDARLRLRVLSPEFEQRFGIPARALLDLDPFDIAERYLGRYGQLGTIAALMQARQPIRNTRLAWRDLQRKRRIALIRGVPRYCEAGQFIGYRGVILDSRER